VKWKEGFLKNLTNKIVENPSCNYPLDNTLSLLKREKLFGIFTPSQKLGELL